MFNYCCTYPKIRELLITFKQCLLRTVLFVVGIGSSSVNPNPDPRV